MFSRLVTTIVTANKVRFQITNALKFIYITVDRDCYKEQNNYKLLQNTSRRKRKTLTTGEIQSDKERHLQMLYD